MPPDILVICGPTASGKTALAVELALRLNGEVVSADSMQIYRHMDIGTAKPTLQERKGVPHHMLDIVEPEEDFSVSRYVELAGACTDDILARGKLPILAGGTGLYIDSLLSGRTFAPREPDLSLRRVLEERCRREGGEALLAELAQVDPDTAGRLHPHDHKRIIRALEVYETTGSPLSRHNAATRALPPRYRGHTIILEYARRRDMWQRIDRRVDAMMEAGLVEEVRALLDRGVPENCTAMQAIGYREMAAALRGDGDTERAAQEIRLHTRQYAKRQLSWFRRNAAAHRILWDSLPEVEKGLEQALDLLRREAPG